MFSFYDILLILCVSLFGTVAAFVRDPQVKSVFATVPVPFGLTYLAVGLPVSVANPVSALLILLYVHVTRWLHDQRKWHILPAIAAGLSLYVGSGAILVNFLPEGDFFFWSAVCGVGVLGVWLLRTQRYDAGVPYRTPLHPMVKFGAVLGVVSVLVFLKGILQGFAPFFPTMNSVTSYEARHSLATQCRQISAFLAASPFLLGSIRIVESYAGWKPWPSLLLGVSLYMAVFWPINLWIRRRTRAASIQSVGTSAK